MPIVAEEDETGLAPPSCRWRAVDDDVYDGAPDSATRNLIGFGATEDEARSDLRRKLAEWAGSDE